MRGIYGFTEVDHILKPPHLEIIHQQKSKSLKCLSLLPKSLIGPSSTQLNIQHTVTMDFTPAESRRSERAM
jgi:hypothetical protein